MKQPLRALVSLSPKSRLRARQALLVSALALVALPALAELPTLTTPTEGIGGTTVAQGDWLGALGAYFKLGITIFVMILCGWAFVQVIAGAIVRWKEYTSGRAAIGDLKEYFVMGAVLAVFMVMLGNYALQTVA